MGWGEVQGSRLSGSSWPGSQTSLSDANSSSSSCLGCGFQKNRAKTARKQKISSKRLNKAFKGGQKGKRRPEGIHTKRLPQGIYEISVQKESTLKSLPKEKKKNLKLILFLLKKNL